MAGHGEKQSRKAELAVAALLSEPTIEAAATKAGVSTRTLKTWLKDPTFLAAYRQARAQIVEAAVTRLQQAATAAVLTLHRNLTCGRPGAEIAAAKTVLEQALRGVDFFDLLGRVEQLERRDKEIMERQ
jgi:hypothetical protein